MSTAKRLISGSLASWAKIVVTLLSQMALVPIYLTYWKIEIYGIWLAVLALINIMSTLDIGHQNFIGYEFFKFGNNDKQGLSKYLWSATLVGVGLGTLQLLLIVIFIVTGVLPRVHILKTGSIITCKSTTDGAINAINTIQTVAKAASARG